MAMQQVSSMRAHFFPLLVCLSCAAQAASLTLDKTPVVLGKTESVAVVIQIDEPEGADLRPLRLAVNVGSFGAVQRLARGKYRAVYTPPGTRFPQVALVAVWRETGADAPIEFLRIPLYGSTTLPVGAKKGAKVSVVVGDDTFGPMVVDADRHIDVPIVVPPGERDADLKVREPNGNSLTKKLPINVPPYNKVTAALVPHAIVADGKDRARLDIFYDSTTTVAPGRIKVKASLGSVTFERAEQGRFVYWYVPPVNANAAQVDFSVEVDGDKAANATTQLRLGLPAPARVVVRPPSKPLQADGVSKAPLQVVVLDNEGLGLPDQQVTLTANGAPVGGLVYRGHGIYEVQYVAPSDYPPGGLVQLSASVKVGEEKLEGVANYVLSATALPKEAVAQVVPAPLPADGRTKGQLKLDVRDEAGLPLPGAKLVAVASHGTLGPLEDEGGGKYRASYTAPDDIPEGEALIRVVDATGGFEQRVVVPMREDPRRFLIGARAGLVHSLSELMGARFGGDLSVPVRAGPVLLWLSVVGQVGWASQQLTDASGQLTTRSDLLFVPMTARLAVEVYASRRFAVQLGAGGGATWAQYSTSLTGESASAWGPNVGGFAAATLSVGPGHFFLEAGYSWAPVSGPGFSAETGGIGAALGYRLGVL
ncbi:MAG: hypothetical protein AB1938_03400 [Myxococcota bacterium]